MKKSGKKFLEILNSKPVIGIFIFIILSLVGVYAGDMVFESGDLNVSGEVNSTGLNVDGNLTVEGNIQVQGAISESATPDKNTLYAKSLPKAWVNFDGTTTSCASAGDLCTIKDSFNVDNVTRDAAGVFTIYWDRDFADSNYVITSFGRYYASGSNRPAIVSASLDHVKTTGAMQIKTTVVRNSASSQLLIADLPEVDVLAFGEQ